MVFNSAAFLFAFFPAVFLLYLLLPGQRSRKILLTAASLLFYAFGGLLQLPVLLGAAVWTYIFGRAMRRSDRRKLYCGLGVAGVLALLGVYKYANFFLTTLSPILGRSFSPLGLSLPLGISFFTFHAISYLVDCYRDPENRTADFGKLLLYLAFFPRLLAGPIVRYREVMEAREALPCSAQQTAEGLRRFIRGMAKKMLLSEGVAALVNGIFAAEAETLGCGLAWLGALGYCLQIYFDFSGYSDMAIGVARLFGYHLPENFDYPYVSRSLSEFWRRWHMTLNRWFVDYLYIPLGGSRCSRGRAVRNKLIVFFFTGLWHGAGWTFILWGLWHGLFVSLEGLFRGFLDRAQKSLPGRVLLRIYTLLVVIVGFVMFRASTVSQGLLLLSRMFSFASAGTAGLLTAESLLTPARIAALLLGCFFCTPVLPALDKRLPAGPVSETGKDLLALLVFALCVLAMSGGSFSPFIYQQF